MAEKIEIEDPILCSLIDDAMADLRKAYPDGKVSGLDKHHKHLGARLSRFYRRAGYASREDFINAYGFETTLAPGSTGGRPVSRNSEDLIAEIALRSQGRNKFCSIKELSDEYPDLKGAIKTLSNKSKEIFGRSLAQELTARGLVEGRIPRSESISDEGIEQMLSALVLKYSKANAKPSTLSKLKADNPDYAKELCAFEGRCKKIYGATPKAKLIECGIFASRRLAPTVDAGEVEKAIDELGVILCDLPMGKKPSSVAELAKAYPELGKTIETGLKVKLTNKQCLQEIGILATPFATVKKKGVRGVSADELLSLFRKAFGDVVVGPESEDAGLLPPFIVGIDTRIGGELRCSVTAARGIKAREASVGQVLPTGVVPNGFHAGKTPRGDSPLAGLVGACAAMVNEFDGECVAHLETRSFCPLRSNTLIWYLRQKGIVTEADIRGGMGWRFRLRMAARKHEASSDDQNRCELTEATEESLIESNYECDAGIIDAMVAVSLIDKGYVFFLDDEITWDGTHHGLAGVQVNVGGMDKAPKFASDCRSLVDGILDLMGVLEGDEGLRIPREVICRSLYGAIREGDLTGITLFNLIACGHAIRIFRDDESVYRVIYDNRLARGIPSFYDLVERMVWDMRDYNGVQGSFQIMFAAARYVDADRYVSDFDGAVPGSVSQALWTEQVCEKPTVDLPSGDNFSGYAEKIVYGFASGFDVPTDMQADEELFEAALNAVARSFPTSIAIEGTHVLGRAARIEGIRVGDPLVLAADWQSPYFDPVCIEVFNSSGETLGNLNEQFSPCNAGSRELACLLPYITATVGSVTPLSKCRKGSRYALMDIHLEIDQGIFTGDSWGSNIDPSVIAAAKNLLALPCAERVVLSKGDLVGSDLNGNVDTSHVEDIANPMESVYEKLDEEEPVKAEEDFASKFVEEDNERQEKIAMLKMLVLAGELGGNVSFPPELLEEVERAENGDETVDLESLAQRMCGIVPDNETADLANVSFGRGTTASGRRFSIAVPDGWTVVENYEESTFFGTLTRPFVIVQGDADGASNLQMRDRVIYSAGKDKEVPEHFAELGIADMKWAATLISRYNKSENGGATGMSPDTVWDEEVQALNTRCFVSQNRAGDGSNGLQIFVTPYALDHNDSLRFSFTYEGEQSVESAREFAKAIARTVRLDKPIVPTCEQMLEKALAGKASADDFAGMVESFAKPYIALREAVFTSYQYKYAANADEFDEGECLIAGARGIAEFNRRAALVLDRLMDAYNAQASAGAAGGDLDKMLEVLCIFEKNAIVDENVFEDGDAAKVKAAGVLVPTKDMTATHDRLARARRDGMVSSPCGIGPADEKPEDEELLATKVQIASAIARAGAQGVAAAIAWSIQRRAAVALASAQRELRIAEADLERFERFWNRYKDKCRWFDESKTQLELAESSVAKFTGKISLLEDSVDSLNASISQLEDRRTLLERELSETSFFSFGKRSALKREQEDLLSKIAESRQELENAVKEKDLASSQLEQRRAWLDEWKSKFDAAEEEVARAKEKLGDDVDAEARRMRERVFEAKVGNRQATAAYEEACRLCGNVPG